MVIQIVWYFYLVYINYLVVAYFNLVCLMISMRFEAVHNSIKALASRELEEMRDMEDMEEMRDMEEQLILLYKDHDETCKIVEESNEFWQYYIFYTFMWVAHSGSLFSYKNFELFLLILTLILSHQGLHPVCVLRFLQHPLR